MKKNLKYFLFACYVLNTYVIFSQILWEKEFKADRLEPFIPVLMGGIENWGDNLLIYFCAYNKQGIYNPGIILTDSNGDLINRKELIMDQKWRFLKVYPEDNGYGLYSVYNYYKPGNIDFPTRVVPYKLILDKNLNIIKEIFDSTNDNMSLGGLKKWEFGKDSIFIAREKRKEDTSGSYYAILVMDNNLNYIGDITVDAIRPDKKIWLQHNLIDFHFTRDDKFLYLMNYAINYFPDDWRESYLLISTHEGIVYRHIRLKYKNKLTWMKSLIETESGDYICLGATEPDMPFIERGKSDSLFYQIDSLCLMKISSDGDLIWQKEYPLPRKTIIWPVIKHLPGLNAYGLFGNFRKGGSYRNKTQNCIYLFNENGDIIFNYSWTPDTSMNCSVAGLTSKEDKVYAFGYIADTLLIGRGYYLCEIDPGLTSINETMSTKSLTTNLFPNPVTDYINLEDIHHVLTGRILIFSIEGIPILEADYSDKLDVSGLQPGVYYLRAGMNYYKFIKI